MKTRKIVFRPKPLTATALKPRRSLYNKDFNAWASKQKTLILSKRFNELDIEHLAEEIGELGISTHIALSSHIKNILLHMLKLTYQNEKKTRSWVISINNARDEINDILEDYPSLKRQVKECIPSAYTRARSKAARETGMAVTTFPKDCPWTQDEILKAKKS